MLKWTVQLTVKSKFFIGLNAIFKRKTDYLVRKCTFWFGPKRIHSEFTYMHINFMYV